MQQTGAQSNGMIPRPQAPPDTVTAAARDSVERFALWLEAFGERSQDPYDFLVSRAGARAKRLYHRHRVLGTLAAAPFVILDTVAPRTRVLFRGPDRYPIADAHYATAFLALGQATEDHRRIERGLAFLAALDRSRSPGFTLPAWGYPFDWETRHGLFRAGWPLMTTIPYCYEAFEQAAETTGDDRCLDTMRGIAEFAAEHIPVTPVATDADASAYTPFDCRRVVNASAYRGFLLTAAGQRFAREDWVAAGERNLRFVCRSRREDGSWPYSMDGTDDFVDNFHTCLVLKNLAKAWLMTGDAEVRDAIRDGYGFYRDRLLDDAGLPVPFAHSARVTLHRRDLYDYAEGINLARLLLGVEHDAAGVLQSLVDDLVTHWQLPDGHFVTRRLVVGRNTVPYHRWAQSQTFHALARLTTRAA